MAPHSSLKFSSARARVPLPAIRNPLIEACAAIDVGKILCRQEGSASALPTAIRIMRGKRNGVFAAGGQASRMPSASRRPCGNVPLLIVAGGRRARQHVRPMFHAAVSGQQMVGAGTLGAGTADLMRRAFQLIRSGRADRCWSRCRMRCSS